MHEMLDNADGSDPVTFLRGSKTQKLRKEWILRVNVNDCGEKHCQWRFHCPRHGTTSLTRQ